MIRTHAGKAVFLFAAAALGASVAMVGCSHHAGPSEDVGAVTVALTLSPGVTVNTVSYSITGNGITAITGNIDVTNATHATALVSGIAPGTGYVLTMNATSTDGLTMCSGTTTFNVTANQTAMANVVLQCHGPRTQTGTVAINGRLDNCPAISGFSANTLEAPVGGSVTIGVTATDLDSDPITYTWTSVPAGVGTFGNPGAASTTFTCTSTGTAQLSIAVSDGVCGDSLSNIIPINCLPANGSTGGATGAGGAVGTGGVAGSSAGGAVGTGGVAGAGMGGVAGSSMGGNGMGGAAGSCAEPVSGTPACCDCTTGNCSLAPATAGGTDGCEGLSDPNDQALCKAAAQCFQAPSHPGNTVIPGACTVSGDATRCFCGNSQGACFATAGAANGPCTAQVIAAAKTSDPAMIRSFFTSPASPLGRAVNLLGCQGSFCAAECSIP